MKTPLYPILLLLIITACRLPRETASNRWHQSSRMQQFHGWQFFDSTTRYWHYMTDTSFYYHPDSGLSARGGILSVAESRLVEKQQVYQKDSVTSLSAASEWTKTKPRTNHWFTISIGAIVLLGLVILLFRRR